MGSLITPAAAGCVERSTVSTEKSMNDLRSGQKRESEVRPWELGMEIIMHHLGHN